MHWSPATSRARWSSTRSGRRRLAYDELFLLQRGLVRHRRAVESHVQAPALVSGGDLIARYLDGLPFALTGAQQRANAAIDADLGRTTPMRRLLQGDVGSGKTAVAVYALLRAVDAGRQGALMAPTETLATQHLVNVSEICADLGVRVVGLTNGMPAAERRAALQVIESGEPLVVVGTHALIQDAVVFGGLGGGGGRRAAPLRRRAAGGAGTQGRRRDRPARPAHDRHPDPQDAGDDRVR